MSDRIGRRQRVDRQQAERRRTVDEDVVEVGRDGVEQRARGAVRAGRAARARSRRRRGPPTPGRSGRRRRPSRSTSRRVATVDDGRRTRSDRAGPVDAEAARGVALGVKIDDEDALAGEGEVGRQIDNRRGLSDAALLVGTGDRLDPLRTADDERSRVPILASGPFDPRDSCFPQGPTRPSSGDHPRDNTRGDVRRFSGAGTGQLRHVAGTQPWPMDPGRTVSRETSGQTRTASIHGGHCPPAAPRGILRPNVAAATDRQTSRAIGRDTWLAEDRIVHDPARRRDRGDGDRASSNHLAPYLRVGDAQPHLSSSVAVVWTVAVGLDSGLAWAFVGGLALDTLLAAPARHLGIRTADRGGSGRGAIARPFHRIRPSSPIIAPATSEPRVFDDPRPALLGALRPAAALTDPLRSWHPSVMYDVILAAILGPLAVAIHDRCVHDEERAPTGEHLSSTAGRSTPVSPAVPGLRPGGRPGRRRPLDPALLRPDRRTAASSRPSARSTGRSLEAIPSTRGLIYDRKGAPSSRTCRRTR